MQQRLGITDIANVFNTWNISNTRCQIIYFPSNWILAILWYINYLLLHDKLPPTKRLNPTHIFISQFLRVRSSGTAHRGPVLRVLWGSHQGVSQGGGLISRSHWDRSHFLPLMVGGSMQCPAAVGLRASGFFLAAGQSLHLALRDRLLFPARWGFSAWLFPPHSQQKGRDSSKTVPQSYVI